MKLPAVAVPSDGYAFSAINSIREDGIALGYYTLFDSNDSDLGNRAFLWSTETGAITLDQAVSGDVAQDGWDYFSNVSLSNGSLIFIGNGRPTGAASGSLGVYAVQVEVVPEPGSALLLLTAAAAHLLRSRRRAGAHNQE